MTMQSRVLMMCCFSMIFLFVFISRALAIDLTSEEREYLRTKNTIVFVSQTRYPPFEFTDADKQHEGMMIDLACWMAVEMGFKPVFMDMTFQQAQEAVLSGKADILTSLFYSDKRNERFEFTKIIFDVPASIFIRAERTDIKDIKDLSDKTIAIQKGDHAKDFLEAQKIRFKTLDTNDFAEATNKVIAGNADAVIGDEQIVFYHIFSNQLTAYIKRVGEPLYIGKNCMASNKSNTILIGIMNKGINEARKSGTLDKISTKWLGTIYGPQKSFLERYLWPLSAIAGGILLLPLLLWIWNMRLRTLVRKRTEIITCREEELRESEAKYRELVENANCIIYKRDTLGNILFFNEYAQKFFGYAKEDIIGKNVIGTILPEIDSSGHSLADIIRDVNVYPEKYAYHVKECICRNGEKVWVAWSNKSILDENGSAREVLCIGSDITERKKVEERLQESERNFRSFFNTVDDMILVGSPNGKILYANPTVSKKLGFTQDELQEMHILELHPAEKRQEAEDIFATMFRGERDICPLPLQGKTGVLVPVETRAWFGKWSGVECIFGICKDLTKEQEALQKFNRVFKNNPALMAVSSMPDRRFTDVNDTFLNTLGYSHEEILGKTSAELGLFVQPEKQREVAEQLQVNGHVINFELQVRCKDGSILDGLFSGDIIESQGGKYFLTVMVDQTERRRVEIALKKSEEMLRLITENTSDMVRVVDMQGINLYVSPSHLKGLGYEQEERIGKPGLDIVHPEDQDKIINALTKGLADNQLMKVEYRVKHAHGYYVWLETIADLLRDNLDKPTAVVMSSRDITDRKRAEERIKTALEEKEILLREIHHRVKNNLAVIISLLSLQADHVRDDQIAQALQESRNRIKSMALIHESLYHSENIATVSMKSYTENLGTKLLQAVKGRDAQIHLLYEIEDIALDINQAIPCGLILNELITNSIKHAFPEGNGRIKVTIRNIDSVEIELVVHDNGVGMREGFDLSNPESLGLMIVATLVEQQLEGSLDIRNEEGACISIRWPSLVKGKEA